MAAVVTITGNLAADPENRVTPSGAENIRFRVIVNTRQGQNENTTAYNVTAWGAQAKGLTTLAQSGRFGKGTKVTLTGKQTAREYQDNSGVTRTSLDVDAFDVEPHFAPRDQQQDSGYGYGNAASANY